MIETDASNSGKKGGTIRNKKGKFSSPAFDSPFSGVYITFPPSMSD